jgi:hypothetical protein
VREAYSIHGRESRHDGCLALPAGLKIAGDDNSRLLLGLSALRVLRLIRLVGMLKWGPRTLLIR